MSDDDSLRVLIVDDDDDDALLIRDCLAEVRLGRPIVSDHAPSARAALTRLREVSYDALLVDYRLGAEDGVTFLAAARAAGVTAPAIFLTGQGDQEVAVQAMKAGAADYLVKAKLAPATLASALRYAMEIRHALEDRAEAERALLASEERYRRVFNQALTSNYISTPGGRILACNEAFARMLGFGGVAEVLAQRAFDLYVEAGERERFLAALGREGRLGHWETQMRRRDGAAISVIENAVAVRDEEGTIVEIQGSMLDVTDRKRTEAALHLRERAIEAMAQGLIITDPNLPDNPIIYVNPGFERITGYPATEVVGRNCRLLQGTAADPVKRAAMRQAIATGEPISVEVLNHRKDGSTFWAHVSITPLRDAAGRLTHFVGIQTDVTARKQLEDELRQSQKMEAIGRLAGGIAHDFNNLLGVILGHGELALTRLDAAAPARRNLLQIVEATSRAANLTHQLLAYSRKQILTPEPVDVNELVAGMEGMLERLIGEDVEVRVLLAPGLGKVMADRGQLEQVVMNLVANARDAMPGGGCLTIETSEAVLTVDGGRPEARPGRYARLLVSDTGSGMDEETRTHAFEPFFTTKEKGKGTGLGLATVFGIIKQSGGHLELHSELGQGTTLEILLPLATVGHGRAMPSQGAPGTSVGGAETVLVVEDDATLAELICQVLEGLGYRVLTARGCDEAVAVAEARSDPIDLLLTDVVLSGPSGAETARRLQALRPRLRVLYMSGYTDEAIGRHGMLAPGVELLPKPFRAETLARKVRAVLDGPPPERE